MNILEIIEERNRQAQQVKESGILDSLNQKQNDELTDIEGYSENVAWSYESQKEEAEKRYNELEKDTGHKIDYSTMK